jgi:hypothetical protein
VVLSPRSSAPSAATVGFLTAVSKAHRLAVSQDKNQILCNCRLDETLVDIAPRPAIGALCAQPLERLHTVMTTNPCPAGAVACPGRKAKGRRGRLCASFEPPGFQKERSMSGIIAPEVRAILRANQLVSQAAHDWLLAQPVKLEAVAVDVREKKTRKAPGTKLVITITA